MSTALQGTRVVDLTSGPAGGIATMILADFGAEVITIERPGADELATLAASPMWQRGKHLLSLDLNTNADYNTFDELCAAADILVCSWRQQALVRKKLNFEALHPRHPHLIYCHLTGFGSRGPLANLPGYEHLLAAYTGRMLSFMGIVDRPGPVFSSLQVGVHA
ncbi:MAG: CoA transferase, partial [Gammaproteobacteria bacterium]|nr:CoA transferase [Gammaproteobacteria bacterium]